MKATLPAGKYYIGDPCYVIEDWSQFCDVWFARDREGIFDFLGGQVCVFHTMYGDGSYACSDGSMLPVDAGLIGAVPLELVTTGAPNQDGLTVTFTEPFKCHKDQDGRLHFGDFSVMTGDDDDERDECPECGHAY